MMQKTTQEKPFAQKAFARLAKPLTLAFTLALASCATQPPTGSTVSPGRERAEAQSAPTEYTMLRNVAALQDRLYRVAAPLLVNNTELCKGNARNLLGFTAKNKYSYSADLADEAQAVLGLDDRLQVMGVLSGSGAAKAGVRRGDKLLAIEGKPAPVGANAERQTAGILLPLMNSRPSVKLNVLRGSTDTALTIPLTRACAFGVELGNADHVNAYNDGRRVMVTRGMMNFAQTDTELAYVLAKELAHNSLRHAAKQNISGTVGDIIDNLTRMQPDLTSMAGTGGIKPMPSEMDVEADKVALYMLARAGYSIDNAARFWQRLATQYPANVLNGYAALHPNTASRLTVIEKTVPEIQSKQAARRTLLP
jgi:hypothetical protein